MFDQVLITNGNLDLVDDGIEFVIKTEQQDLVGCDVSLLTVLFLSNLRKQWMNGVRPSTPQYVRCLLKLPYRILMNHVFSQASLRLA